MEKITREEAEGMSLEEAANSSRAAVDYETEKILMGKTCIYLGARDVLDIAIDKNGIPGFRLHKRYRKMNREQIFEDIEKREFFSLANKEV